MQIEREERNGQKMFSDKSQLDKLISKTSHSPTKNVFYWMDLMDVESTGNWKEKRKRCLEKEVFSPGVMVWAGIGSRGTTTIHFCEKIVDSQYYQRILNENYLPFHQQGFILMQVNATPHTSQSTLKFLEDKNIDVLEWAPHSRL